MKNALHLAAEGLTSAAATANSRGQHSLCVGLDYLSGLIAQEADDAEEQIAEGLDAEAALCGGLNAAVHRAVDQPAPDLPRMRHMMGWFLLVPTTPLAIVGLSAMMRGLFG